MTTKERVIEEINGLSEEEVREVAEYLALLKLRARGAPPVSDEAQLAALYAEFADEDRRLAEAGMNDYAKGLAEEDAA
ncbi:MAG TPA: hypothetical protein VFX96_15700 [Pyrinomonadaceae bacterium]|nr:hypothetical protein [Pyrinomonadaceae bacterium]